MPSRAFVTTTHEDDTVQVTTLFEDLTAGKPKGASKPAGGKIPPKPKPDESASKGTLKRKAKRSSVR